MKKYIALGLVLVGLASCNFLPKENTTYGKARIGVDATLEPAIASELYMFKATYKNSDLQPYYAPEVDIIKNWEQDSFQTIILTRPLNTSENEYFASRKIVPRITPIAKDGIAIILNKNNPDSLLSYEEVIKIFEGNLTNWSNISSSNRSGDINLLFDSPNSSIATYFMTLTGKTTLPPNAYAAQYGNMEVIEKVSQSKSALGLVGLAWLGDLNNATLNAVNKQVRIAYVRPKGSMLNEYYKADQMNLSDSLYPFIRQVNIIECSGGTTLATGFASFCYNEQGQRIMAKTGILPQFPPERQVTLKVNNRRL